MISISSLSGLLGFDALSFLDIAVLVSEKIPSQIAFPLNERSVYLSLLCVHLPIVQYLHSSLIDYKNDACVQVLCV